jgi:RHH-type proline utilization regulon transcriptional repressor/proline dehydrogenase/delta 1-pyrroline-5-carboxylate dehydrogenase
VLQAYLPDSLPLQRELTAWAEARIQQGGAPIRLRVVKGANLLTERADSALRGLVLPIFSSKSEVDAGFKAMVEFGCQPAHAQAVQLGIASHNLFDIAFGMVERAVHGTEALVCFELLEGMADHVCRALTQIEQGSGNTLLYAPLCEEASMQTAIAYLVRRLDENTAEQNFLRHSFAMQPGDQAWQGQQKQFIDALANRRALSHEPRRGIGPRKPRRTALADAFANEPDTDFSVAHSRTWITAILDRWSAGPCIDVPLHVGAESRFTGACEDGFDPSRPTGRPYRHALATEADIECALTTAATAALRWQAVPVAQRVERLLDVAQALREQRGELIAAMVLDAGKRVDQADAEVSEAIDFAEYYARSMLEWSRSEAELELHPKGVVLVTPPWNFPLAIPLGGVLAALVAGNSVILKPALETVLVGEHLARLCWSAGIPQDALQLVVCSDDSGSQLIRDPRVAQVVLTGGTQTARLFQQLRPGLSLMAETGGKNSLIVSAMSDRDEAIKDALASAFGHAGQKCSACSLLVLEAEVYDDPEFLATLRDAAASLHVGSSWDPRSVITPLINPPQGALLRGLTTLEDGEEWLLEPKRDLGNLRLWSPGIKLGVREGSFTHTTEFFGPLLAVMRAEDLEHAVRIANATPYGLTAGLHSLDESEQQRWSDRIEAGNLYINRPITGAIVRRQPFGGHKASSFGPGAKAGGPNYVLQMTHPKQRSAPRVVSPPLPEAAELIVAARRHLTESDRERVSIAACSYAEAHRRHFAVDHDPSMVTGERNVFRYRPSSPMLLRAASGATLADVLMACVAAITAGAVFELSLEPSLAEAMPYLAHLPRITLRVQDATLCAQHITRETAHLRALGGLEPEVRAAAEAAHVHMSCEPVLLSGRVELLRYHREQSLSHRYHRYGNLAGEDLLLPLRSAAP